MRRRDIALSWMSVVMATALASPLMAKPWAEGNTTEVEKAKAKVAYRVKGLMKTKSGAT